MDNDAKRTEHLARLAPNPEIYGHLLERIDSTSGEPAWLVFLGLQTEMPPERRLEALAKAVGQDVYTVRQWMGGPVPRLLLREQSEARAAEWGVWLDRVGVRHFSVETRILAATPPVHVSAVYTEPGRILFERSDGVYTPVERDGVRSIAFAEVQERILAEEVVKGLAGEMHRPGAVERVEREVVIDVHPAGAEVILRLHQHGVRYSAMYPSETGGSSVLIRRLLGTLEKAFPAARLYRDFPLAEGILGVNRGVLRDVIELRHRLLAVLSRHQAVRERTLRESSYETFDLYSRLVRLDALADGAPR